MTRKSMQTVIEANKAAGKYWFEPDTMRFFNSYVESGLIGGRFFITSERGPHQDRKRFTIREAIDGGREIETVGDFQAYASLVKARNALADHVLSIEQREEV